MESLVQLVAGQIDAAWILDVLVIIIIGIIAFLYKDIRTELKDIKNSQHSQAIDIAKIKTKLKIEEE